MHWTSANFILFRICVRMYKIGISGISRIGIYGGFMTRVSLLLFMSKIYTYHMGNFAVTHKKYKLPINT